MKFYVIRHKVDGVQTKEIHLFVKKVVSLLIPQKSHKVIVSFGFEMYIMESCGLYKFSGSMFIISLMCRFYLIESSVIFDCCAKSRN